MKTLPPVPSVIVRPISARQMQARNPALAAKWAAYVLDNKAAIVARIAGRILSTHC